MTDELRALLIALTVGIVVPVVPAACASDRGAPSNPSPSGPGRACTQEAKLCPDGSAVGRTGPDCAFADCPGGDRPRPTEGPSTGADDARCTAPRPGPTAVCVQACGAPAPRVDDPPPGWQWLSPEDAKNRAQYGCPICLPADASIATPGGEVAVSSIVEGALVWSLDEAGRRVAVPVVRVGSTPAPVDHTLVVLELADGRTVAASAGHPIADGRRLGQIDLGDTVDGARVVARTRREHGGRRTFDLLPFSTTGTYWADGVLLRSTLGGALLPSARSNP